MNFAVFCNSRPLPALCTLVAAAFVICSIPAGAQGKYIQKVYAYKEVRPGTNIFMNDTTNTGATDPYNYLIYVELPERDTPIWHTAIIGSETYSVHAALMTETPLVVGERKRDQRLVRIRPQPATRLWKLEFDLTGEKATAPTEGTVVLKGTFKNTKITSTVGGIVELQSP